MLSEFMEYFKAVSGLMSAGLIFLLYPHVGSHNCLRIFAQEYLCLQSYVPTQEDCVSVQVAVSVRHRNFYILKAILRALYLRKHRIELG